MSTVVSIEQNFTPTIQTMHRADSTRSNTSSRSLRTAGDSKQQEDLINALEAEEERLVNTLTRKLEKLRAEKAELENVLEAESESLVLRLQRQLSALMQQQQQSSQPGSISGPPNNPTAPNSPSATISPNLNALINLPHPLNPSPATLIEALKSENSNLRNRLVDTEREFIRTTRQNEMYRNELIALRQRAGIPIDDLITTVTSGEDIYPSARAARRRSRGTSTSGNGVPIPGLSGAENHRRPHHALSISSSSAQPSFASSTPMTPSSLTGESAHLISASLGTSFTTPSTSYPGLPVPHSTPAASPANDHPSDYAVAHSTTLNVSANEAIMHSSPTGEFNQKFPSNPTPTLSPSQSTAERSRTGSLSNGRVAETGVLRSSNRVTNPNPSSLMTSGGAPGGPENRQQFNPSSK